MVEISTLRTLVDASPDNVSALRNDLPGLYAYVGLPTQTSHFSTAVTNALSEKIWGALSTTAPRKLRNQCGQLLDELILQHILEGAPLSPYFRVVEVIRGALPHESVSPQTPTNDDWPVAISAACDFCRLNSWGNEDMIPQSRPRQFAGANAALTLRNLGYELRIERERVFLSPESEERVVKRLETLVELVGGCLVAANIFRCIASRYDAAQERFHLVRGTTTSGTNVSPNVPFGYILLLAVKRPIQRVNPPFGKENWAELIQLSTNYAALFDAQPYSSFETMFKDSTSLVRFLQEIALYDTLFTIPQIRPRDAIKIASGVLAWIDSDQKFEGGWTVGDVLTVADQVLKMGDPEHRVAFFGARDVAERCKGMDPALVLEILDSVLSHPPKGANQDYSKVTDLPGPDFFLRPLLSQGRGNYCILNASACAPAVIEALFAPLRKAMPKKPKFDDRIGEATEVFLRREFEAHGINPLAGKYHELGQDGECDLVIEASETIIFLEVKKKALTRKARAGTDMDVILDLAGSLLDAQFQAGTHELLLKTQGYLDLVDGSGKTSRVDLNGRGVERIAVSLLDYGGFQDRLLLDQFLRSNLGVRYNAVDPKHQEQFDELNEKIIELNQQVSALLALDPDIAHRPFFNCWFLSVPQLLILLDDVSSCDDFRAALWDTRHFSTGNLNFYFDHKHAKTLKKKPSQAA